MDFFSWEVEEKHAVTEKLVTLLEGGGVTDGSVVGEKDELGWVRNKGCWPGHIRSPQRWQGKGKHWGETDQEVVHG